MNARRMSLFAAPVFFTGCVIYTSTGPVRHESQSISRDNCERMHVDLKMGAGDLKVTGGADSGKLAQADFTYNVPSWEPKIEASGTGARRDLVISQPRGSHSHMGNTKYQWDLALANEVALDLEVHFGAGEAKLDLGSLFLRSVEIDMGVGELQMDLRGKPKHDYTVNIRGGVGEVTVHLPAGVGVYAEGSGGIGEIHTEGLRKESGHWVNDAYEDSKTRVRVSVHGGIGEIRLIAD